MEQVETRRRPVWPRGGLWRESDFLKLWSAQAISALGSRITRTALPILAVLSIGAGAAEGAVLSAGAGGAGGCVGRAVRGGGAAGGTTARSLLGAAVAGR